MINPQQYDAIVIGSGIGGLTAASILAQVGKRRVLVLERHFKLGGFTHSFRRKNFVWDVGVHYVGEMHPTALARKIMDLVTGRGVQWQSMGRTVERVLFPGFSFEIPDDRKQFEQKLIALFPAERNHIKQYFKDVAKARGWMVRWFVSKQYPSWLARLLTSFSGLAHGGTAKYLEQFSDPRLRAVLAAQWPDFGTIPAESAFGFHAAVTADYFAGGYYPVGGSQKIADHAAGMIVRHGGKCEVGHQVTEIICEAGKAIGVRVKHKQSEKVFYAPVIISNAGAVTTFSKLVPDSVCQPERERVARLCRGTSALVLFLGLKADPRKYGFDDANYWLYNTLDHDAQPKVTDAETVPLNGLFLSFGSLRDPEATHHTAQVIGFCNAEPWSQFRDSSWMRRSKEYGLAKENISQRMLAFVQSRFPQLAELIEHQEVATPLTIENFTSHEAGMIYGQRCDLNRLTRDQWSSRTSLGNLYLAGSDVGTPGVNGSMMASAMTAACVLGWTGLPRIFAHAYR